MTLEDAVTVVSVMESSMQVRFLADIATAAIPHLRDSVYHVDICQLHFFGAGFMHSWKVGHQRP